MVNINNQLVRWDYRYKLDSRSEQYVDQMRFDVGNYWRFLSYICAAIAYLFSEWSIGRMIWIIVWHITNSAKQRYFLRTLGKIVSDISIENT